MQLSNTQNTAETDATAVAVEIEVPGGPSDGPESEPTPWGGLALSVAAGGILVFLGAVFGAMAGGTLGSVLGASGGFALSGIADRIILR